jgi:hypothetical protein
VGIEVEGWISEDRWFERKESDSAVRGVLKDCFGVDAGEAELEIDLGVSRVMATAAVLVFGPRGRFRRPMAYSFSFRNTN